MVIASALLAILVGGAFAVLLVALQQERNSSDLSRESQAVLVAANRLERLVIDLETGERGYVIAGEERFLEPWNAARRALPEASAELARLGVARAQRARVQRIVQAVTSYLRDYSQPLVDAARRNDPSARSVTTIQEGKRRVDELRGEFDGLLAAEEALAKTQEGRARAATRRAIFAGVGGLAASIVLIALFAGYLTRAIVLPVRRASTMAGRLAGGDLTVRMAETGTAEIGALERSFNTMASSLQASRHELTTSRARVVAAADEARRKIERDLHDGIQQRLVSLGLELRAAESAVPSGLDELKAQLSRTASRLAGVVEELQEVSRGIHPAILSKGGLGPALKGLARRSSVPVELDLRVPRRLPERVEVAAYYVVSEALTNAAKHAQASAVEVCAEADDSLLRVSVSDDGIGGAEPRRGSGLIGLRDRVEALGGTLEIASPAEGGTSLVVTIPLAVDGSSASR
jgi:signal transduction histidine kinase